MMGLAGDGEDDQMIRDDEDDQLVRDSRDDDEKLGRTMTMGQRGTTTTMRVTATARRSQPSTPHLLL